LVSIEMYPKGVRFIFNVMINLNSELVFMCEPHVSTKFTILFIQQMLKEKTELKSIVAAMNKIKNKEK
jgi:hypothetical protein